jgi:hypothetical protein
MSETTSYEKRLEAQNDQLRATLHNLLVEHEKYRDAAIAMETDYNNLVKDIDKMFRKSQINFSMIKLSRSDKRDYPKAHFDISWNPTSSSTVSNTSQPIHNILREIWLDYLQGQVTGMKWSIKDTKHNKYVIYSTDKKFKDTQNKSKLPTSETFTNWPTHPEKSK